MLEPGVTLAPSSVSAPFSTQEIDCLESSFQMRTSTDSAGN